MSFCNNNRYAQGETQTPPRTLCCGLVFGALLALMAFLLPAVPLLLEGEEAFRGYQPDDFRWSLFIPGYLLMVTSLWRIACNSRTSNIAL